MTKDIANYGGSTEDFDHFMTYVEKAGSINTMKGSLKTASLENHKIAGWLGTLVSA
jgi:hypothetical protein